MKRIDRFAHKLAAGIVMLALMALATTASAVSVPQVIKVIRLQGDARYSTDNKTWTPLKKGDVLRPGTVIITAAKSTVDLLLSDKDASGPSSVSGTPYAPATTQISAPGGSSYIAEEERANVVRVFQSSKLGIDRLTLERNGVDEVTETQLDLKAGQIMGNVKKQSAGSKYEVKIPNGVAGIRGTVYVISSSGVVDVLKGQVVVAVVGADGSVTTRVVSAKNSFDPATGVISPIPGDLYGRLVSIYHELHGGAPTGPTTFPVDHTIVYVSPVDGGGNH